MAEETQLAEYNADVLDSAPGIREAFMLMLADVPEPDDDAVVKIVGAILKAESVEDLDSPWDTAGMRSLVDRPLTVRSITKRPSDYENGMGVYLGCEVLDEMDGEELFVSSGSVSIVAQLVRAHTLKAFPLRVIPRNAKKPTPKGYLPMHLELIRVKARS